MPDPSYFARFQRLMLRNQAHADAMNEAAAILSGFEMPEMKRRTGDDPDQIDELIDALLDKYIATCDGDPRLALFGVLSMYGQAMHALAGRRGAGGR